MSTGQSPERDEPSLRDQLELAHDAVESIDDPQTSNDAGSPNAPAYDRSSQPAGEQGTDAGTTAAKPPGGASTDPATADKQPGTDAPRIEPMPPGFPGGEVAWKGLPADHRSWLKQREVQVEKYVRQHGEASRFGATMWGAVRPYEALIRSQGVHPAQVVQGALAQHFRLAQGSASQKAGVIQELAQQYGVDLTEVAAQALDNAPQQRNPEVDQLKGALQQMALYLRNQEEQRLHGQYRGAQEAVGAFSADPQFEHAKDPEVREYMARHLDSGGAQDLAHAYELAVWNVPRIRNSLLEKRGRDQAGVARNALRGAPVRGGAPVAAVMAPSDESIRGSLERQFAALE